MWLVGPTDRWVSAAWDRIGEVSTRMEPRAQRMEPRAQRMEPRAQRMEPRAWRTGPRGGGGGWNRGRGGWGRWHSGELGEASGGGNRATVGNSNGHGSRERYPSVIDVHLRDTDRRLPDQKIFNRPPTDSSLTHTQPGARCHS